MNNGYLELTPKHNLFLAACEQHPIFRNTFFPQKGVSNCWQGKEQERSLFKGGGDNKLNTNKNKVGFKMIALHEH